MKYKEIIGIANKYFLKWYLNGYLSESKFTINLTKHYMGYSKTLKCDNLLVNNIYINSDIVKYSSNGQENLLIENIIYHELAHTIYTDIDLTLMKKRLKRNGIPFKLFNLFEDIRIEALVTKRIGHKFIWNECLNDKYLGKGIKTAEAFMNILNIYKYSLTTEYIDEYLSLFEDYEVARALDIIEIIKIDYFEPIQQIDSMYDLIPLLIKWQEQFHIRKCYALETDKGMEELLLMSTEDDNAVDDDSCIADKEDEEREKDEEENESDEDQGGSSGGEEEDDCKNPEGNESDEDASDKYKIDYTNLEKLSVKIPLKMNTKDSDDGNTGTGLVSSSTIPEHSERDLLSKRPQKYDRTAFKEIIDQYKKIFIEKTTYESTRRPSKRIHKRNLLLNKDKFYKKKNILDKVIKKISIVIDCSGSMNYNMSMSKMKLFIAAINYFAIKGYVDGYIILSIGKAMHTLKMPLTTSEIDRINPFPCPTSEGLQRTISKCIKPLSNSEHIFVVTDGHIVDEPIDKVMLAKHRINPIGLYIGKTVDLSKWFNESVCRDNIEDLTSDIIKLVGFKQT